jgi:hypothetical protein
MPKLTRSLSVITLTHLHNVSRIDRQYH